MRYSGVVLWKVTGGIFKVLRPGGKGVEGWGGRGCVCEVGGSDGFSGGSGGRREIPLLKAGSRTALFTATW